MKHITIMNNIIHNKYWKKFKVDKLMHKERSKSLLRKFDSRINMLKTPELFEGYVQ